MNYVEARNNIEALSRFGSVLGLDNIYELLKRLDNPQEKLNIIHVAGTNGKGSTIAYLSSILSAAGYKVGKYTSPVVFEYLEKYQINNKNISESEFATIAKKTMSAVSEMVLEGNGQPTIFEVETAMAYLYFYESECDIAIIETGMGGDMDATNVCSSVLASVITSISLDHVGILGNTIQEIAACKAGIIKKNCPVILYGQSEEVTNVIRSVAGTLNAPLVISDTKSISEKNIRYKTATGYVYEKLKPSLCGLYQLKNLTTALETIEQLKKQGLNITEDAVKQGVEKALWNGRFEKISEEPLFIIDGAHNPDAVSELKKTIDIYYPKKKWVFIMGVLADKDFAKEASILSGMAEMVITVTPNNARALAAENLGEVVKSSDVAKEVVVADGIDEAIKLAIDKYRLLGSDAGILAFGSLSYLGELKGKVVKYVEKHRHIMI